MINFGSTLQNTSNYVVAHEIVTVINLLLTQSINVHPLRYGMNNMSLPTSALCVSPSLA